MKKRNVIILLLAGFVLTSVHAQEKVIQPSSVIAMPKITKTEWNNLCEMVDEDEESQVESKYGDLSIYDDLYSEKCSWYCGGEVKSVTASSCLQPIKFIIYENSCSYCP